MDRGAILSSDIIKLISGNPVIYELKVGRISTAFTPPPPLHLLTFLPH